MARKLKRRPSKKGFRAATFSDAQLETMSIEAQKKAQANGTTDIAKAAEEAAIEMAKATMEKGGTLFGGKK